MVSCVGAARGKLQRSGRRVLVCGGVCQPLVRTHRCAPPSEDGGGGGGGGRGAVLLAELPGGADAAGLVHRPVQFLLPFSCLLSTFLEVT